MLKTVWKDLFPRALVAFLYALGLSMTLLCVMGFTSQIPLCALLCLLVTLLCSAASLRKWGVWLLSGCVGVAASAWLAFMGGATTLTDVLRASVLHVSGNAAALPLFQREAVLLLSLLCGFASVLLTHRSAGGYPALIVVLLAVLLLWLGDTPRAMLYLLPAVVATLALLIHTGHATLPLRRVLPLTIAIVLLSYLIVPASGVTIAPLKETADTLRQKIFDYLFFTAPRNVFTLASEGYYPLGQNQLGGPATPDEEPVMMVSTPKMVYLRGSVKDEYTGRSWVDTQSGFRYLWVSPRWRSERSAVFNETLPQGALGADEGLMSVEQISIRMMNGSASSLFLPQRIRDLQPGGDLVPYFNASSEVFATRDLQAGDTYTVSAPLMLGGEAGMGTLVTACAAAGDANWHSIQEIYTKLPDHLQEELYELAQEITAEASTPYDKAYALQTYLSRTYRYALDVEVLPSNVDFVSYFLLKSKEGYCTYFASAMTVLCRMVGLPARYVEGYLARPEANGVAYVTGMDAHAWTEVYFEGFGWLTFDATPILSNQGDDSDSQDPQDDPEIEDPLPTPTPEEQPEEPTPTPQPEDEPSPEPSDQPDAQHQDSGKPSLWWLLILLLLLIAAAVRILMTQPAFMVSRATGELARWMILMQAVHDTLTVLHLPRRSSESPMAYMRRLDASRRVNTTLTPLGECEALVFYGKVDPEPDETRMAQTACQQLFTSLIWHQKAQLILLRAFVPLKHRSFTQIPSSR